MHERKSKRAVTGQPGIGQPENSLNLVLRVPLIRANWALTKSANVSDDRTKLWL